MSIHSSKSFDPWFREKRRLKISRLGPAMALKHGYTGVDDFRNNAQKKFSLVETGIIDKPSTRLLLINV